MKFIKNIITFYFLTIFLIVGLAALYTLKANDLYYSDITKSNKEIQNIAWHQLADEANLENPLDTIDLNAVQQSLPNAVGWIYQEDSPINYPIMHSQDANTFYLHHNPYGKASFGGSVFMDQNNAPDFSDRNTILYGHNLKNGEMFGTLKKAVTDKEYFDSHSIFYICTPRGVAKYGTISVYTAMYNEGEFQIDFDSNDDYKKFLMNTVSRSVYDTGIQYNTQKPVITLSSCYSSGTEGIKTIFVLQELDS